MKFWRAVLSLASCFDVVMSLPDGFSDKELFDGPWMTDIAFADEDMGHLMFVSQKDGLVNVYEPGDDYSYKDKTEALDITEIMCTNGERGLTGIQLHPKFDANNIVYTYYTFNKHGNCKEDEDIGPVNRLSTWIYDPDNKTIDPDSELVLLETPSTKRADHNSGKIEFGKDGFLYVTIGDTGNDGEAGRLNSVLGGIVRLTDTGGIPGDNPFVNDSNAVRCNEYGRAESDEKCLELYALGLRNPFRFAMDPNTEGNKVRFFVNDVGWKTWEEINEGGDDFRDGKAFNWELGIPHYGWPAYEGPCIRGTTDECDYYEGFVYPFHFYLHQGGGAATGGAFVPKGVWPEEYDGKYLYADYLQGYIHLLDDEDEGKRCRECTPPDSSQDSKLFLLRERVMTMRFGPYVDGQMALYYTIRAGDMRQVACDACLFLADDSGAVVPAAPPTMSLTEAPVVTQPSRPDGEGGYPGVPFPWNSGDVCPQGYDFCGVLEFCMDLRSSASATYGYRLPCMEETCECQSVPGPLIRLLPGKKYKLTLRNAGTEVTNLHTHGLHIVGDGDGDDVIREVMGGGNCLDYTWDIKLDHPGGTNWYHAHHHGISEKQVGGGAYGMLIVEDNPLELGDALLPWAANELLLQVAVAVHTDEMFANGRKTEVIDIAAKQWYRLRVSFVNANALPYNFTFGDDGMCDIHKVAQDGVWRSVVPGPQSSAWELTGASRADFAVRCNTSDALVPVFYRDDELVAYIWVGAEESNPHVLEEFTPNRPYSISDMLNESVPEENQFSVRLGFDYVNDEYWNPMEPIATISYNQVHEWTLMQTWFHPFHMHLYHMQIATPGGCGAHEEGEFYDTISAPSNCTVRFRTADIGQRCVLHCHVLEHEDSGSMSWVNVTGEGMPMNTAQSFEYACPAETLPDSNRCVPGFLGITSDPNTSLKGGEEFVNYEFGVYIKQQGDGNLVVRRGTPANRGEVVWAHGQIGSENPYSPYFTKLQPDSNLITRSGTPEDAGTILWKSDVGNPQGDYFLGIDCKREIVSVYTGNRHGLGAAVSVWNSEPTASPTNSPTQPPTAVSECIPGYLGVTTEDPLLAGEDFVNSEFGVFIRQQRDGNLVVRRGTPANRGEVVWAHGQRGNASSYFTQLYGDSNLITFTGAPASKGAILWKSNTVNAHGDYFLGIDCNSEIVSVYAGKLDSLGRGPAVAVWNSAPTAAPTSSPNNNNES